MKNITVSKWQDLIPYAPCYFNPPNDGASWRCNECKLLFDNTKIFGAVIPNNSIKYLCNDCLDKDWKENATELNVTFK